MGRIADPPIASQVKRDFGARLRRYRDAEEVTQDALAEALGISRDRYAKYEAGKAEMPYWLLIRLEEATGKDIRFWVSGRHAGDTDTRRLRAVR